MNAAENADKGRIFTAWVAIIGGVLAFCNLVAYILATGGDLELMFKPALALSMTPQAHNLFIISMVTDSFGFYLPFVAIGAYFWRQLRDKGGVLVDVAAMAVLIYVLLGIAGTSMQIAALSPLAAAHAAGDAGVQAATEAAWLAVVQATENGLWWMEGPAVAFWALVFGTELRRQGGRYGWLLSYIGVAYALSFCLVAVGQDKLAGNIELLLLLPVIAAMLLIGRSLLRKS